MHRALPSLSSILIGGWCLWASTASAEVRTWTDITGRGMQAEFIREVDGDASFLKQGKIVTVPLDQLCDADRKLIQELEASKTVEATKLAAGIPRPAPAEEAASDLSQFTAPAGDLKPSITKKRINPELRTWTHIGRHQTTAKFVRLHDGKVILVRGGRVIWAYYWLLSAEDREYVTNILNSRNEGNLIPARPDDLDALVAEATGAPFAPAADGLAMDAAAASPQPTSIPMPGGGGGRVGGGPGMGNGSTPGSDRLAQQMQEMQERSARQQEETQRRNAEQMAANEERARLNRERQQQLADANRQMIEARKDAFNNQLIAQCSGCKKDLTREQSQLTKCPHCGAIWSYEIDRWGHKKELPGAALAAAQAEAEANAAGGDGWKEWFRERKINRLISKLTFRIVVPAMIALGALIAGIFRGWRN